jgi:hypothetical protein
MPSVWLLCVLGDAGRRLQQRPAPAVLDYAAQAKAIWFLSHSVRLSEKLVAQRSWVTPNVAISSLEIHEPHQLISNVGGRLLGADQSAGVQQVAPPGCRASAYRCDVADQTGEDDDAG